MTGLPVYPLESSRAIGSIIEVGPTSAKANLPFAADTTGRWHHGDRLGLGEVGEFVVIEGTGVAVFGRLINVRLPERERLTVEAGLGRRQESHPVGTIQLLTTVTLDTGAVAGGIAHYPRLGGAVYTASPEFIGWLAEAAQRLDDAAPSVTLRVAKFRAPDMGVRIYATPGA